MELSIQYSTEAVQSICTSFSTPIPWPDNTCTTCFVCIVFTWIIKALHEVYTTVVILSGTERHLPPASGADQPLNCNTFLTRARRRAAPAGESRGWTGRRVTRHRRRATGCRKKEWPRSCYQLSRTRVLSSWLTGSKFVDLWKVGQNCGVFSSLACSSSTRHRKWRAATGLEPSYSAPVNWSRDPARKTDFVSNFSTRWISPSGPAEDRRWE